MSGEVRAWLHGGPRDGELVGLRPGVVVERLRAPQRDLLRFTASEGTAMLTDVYRRDGRPWDSVFHGRVIDYQYEGVSA